MLTFHTMGYIALWILWGNALLVALAAAQRGRALLGAARARDLASLPPRTTGANSVGVIKGTVAGEAALAEHSVLQNGRIGASDDPSIVWHDRAYESRILGGHLLLSDGQMVHVPATREGAKVWLSAEAMERSARCPDADSFASAYGDARRVKGFARTVVASIEPGVEVFAAGALRWTTDGWSLEASAGELLLSTFDPRTWARRRAAFVFGLFIPGILACAAACTAVALSEPVFESGASKLGAVLGVAFFLLVLPAATTLRDRLREPHERILRGRWVATHEASVAPATTT